jgi:hypothetical protein
MTRRIFYKVLLVAVAVFVLLALSSVLLAQGRSEEAFERVKAAQERHTKRLMAIEGVEGTAIGLDENDALAVKVFTAGPGVRGIPKDLDGVPVHTVVSGKIYALVDPTARFPRPVPTGVSTGHPNITAGTIGCRVKDSAGNVYALSNNHVYANENRASIGDNVLQPGAYDGGVDPGDAIGTLYDFEPILFGMFGVNIIDAAIALCSTGTLDNKTPDDGYGIPSSTTAAAYINQAVQKYGRTTRLTTGTVTAVNGIFLVRYSRSFAMFFGQIVIEPGSFSAGGDSGSLIVTDDLACNPVGLLFAGSDTTTIANPIDLVLLRFGVTIDDSSTEPPQNQPPTADFSWTASDLAVDFTDQSSDSDGSVVAWNWNFGDVGTSTAQNPSHTYAAAGTYAVILTVTDDVGATSSTSQSVTVTAPSGGVTVTAIEPPTMQAGTTEGVTITGSGFVAGANVTFENGSGPTPQASNVVVIDVDADGVPEITATVKAKKGGPRRDRLWDVRVTNPDGSTDVLVGGFTVQP